MSFLCPVVYFSMCPLVPELEYNASAPGPARHTDRRLVPGGWAAHVVPRRAPCESGRRGVRCVFTCDKRSLIQDRPSLQAPFPIRHVWLSLGPQALVLRQDLRLLESRSWRPGGSWRPGRHFPSAPASSAHLAKMSETFGMSGSLGPAAPWFLVVPPRSSQEIPLAKHPS